MKKFFRRKMVALLGVGLMLMVLTAHPASGYSVSLSYYEGFDLESGAAETDPTVLMIVVGVQENAQQENTQQENAQQEDAKTFLGLDQVSFEFSPKVDVHVEFGALVAEDAVKLAFLKDTAYDAVNVEMLASLNFEDTYATPFTLDAADTLVLLTNDGGYFKLGNVLNNLTAWTLAFDYEKLGQIETTTEPVPEPATLALFGVGLIGVYGVLRRKSRDHGGIALLLAVGIGLVAFAGMFPISAQAQDWTLEYRNGADLSVSPAQTQTAPELNLNWGTEPPGGMCSQQSCVHHCQKILFFNHCWDDCSTSDVSCWGLNADNFSVRATKQVTLDAGDYTFIAKADDSVRVKVDGQEILSGSANQPLRTLWKTVALSSGPHTLQVEYHDATGTAQVALNFGKAEDFKVLTVNKLELGAGAVTGDGVSCGADCAEIYPKGATVNLTAAPDEFSTFAGWEGACSGTGACTVTMDADQAATAKFDASWKAEYLNSAGAVTHAQGEASLNIDYDWDTGYPGTTCQNCYRKCDSLLGVKYNCRTECTPYSCWSLPVNNFTVRWTRAVKFAAGDYVFFAKVDADNGIRAWVDGQEIINGSAYNFGKKMTLTDGMHTVKVEYHEGTGPAQVQFRWGSPDEFATLKVVNAENFGKGTVTADSTLNCGAGCETIYEKGTPVTLIATPDAASAFGGWSGACSGSDGQCLLTLDADQTVTARFDAQWKAEYFSGPISAGPNNTRTEATIAQDWGAGIPGGMCSVCVQKIWKMCVKYQPVSCWGLPADGFSVRWTKKSNFETASYTFIANTDDYVSVAIDGNEILNSAAAVRPAQSLWKTVLMTEGAHDVRVIYRDLGNAAQAAFKFGKAEDFKVLTVQNPSNLGSGKVTANGIDCGADCQEIYAKGASVPVAATPDTGAVLGTWEGACSGDGACTVKMDTDKTLTANFDPLWKAEYFATADCSGNPAKVQTEAKINYVAGAAWPGAGIQCVRWTRPGSFDEGFYTFVATSPKPLRVALDNTELINGQSEHEGNIYWNAVNMTAGKHDLKVEYAPKLPALNGGQPAPLGDNTTPAASETVSFYQLKGKPATLLSVKGPACVKVGQQLVANMFTLHWMPETPTQQNLTFTPAVVPKPTAQDLVPFPMPKGLPSMLTNQLQKLQLPVGWTPVSVTADSPNRGTVFAASESNGIIPNIPGMLLAVDENAETKIKDWTIKIPEFDKCSQVMQVFSRLSCLAGPAFTITPPKIDDISIKVSASPLCCPDLLPAVRPSLHIVGSGGFSLGSVEGNFLIPGSIPYIIEVGGYLKAGGDISFGVNGVTTCQNAAVCGNVAANVYIGGGVFGRAIHLDFMKLFGLHPWLADARLGLLASILTEDGKLCYQTDRGLCLTIPKVCAQLKAEGYIKLFFGLIKKSIDKSLGKACTRAKNVGKCF